MARTKLKPEENQKSITSMFQKVKKSPKSSPVKNSPKSGMNGLLVQINKKSPTKNMKSKPDNKSPKSPSKMKIKFETKSPKAPTSEKRGRGRPKKSLEEKQTKTPKGTLKSIKSSPTKAVPNDAETPKPLKKRGRPSKKSEVQEKSPMNNKHEKTKNNKTLDKFFSKSPKRSGETLSKPSKKAKVQDDNNNQDKVAENNNNNKEKVAENNNNLLIDHGKKKSKELNGHLEKNDVEIIKESITSNEIEANVQVAGNTLPDLDSLGMEEDSPVLAVDNMNVVEQSEMSSANNEQMVIDENMSDVDNLESMLDNMFEVVFANQNEDEIPLDELDMDSSDDDEEFDPKSEESGAAAAVVDVDDESNIHPRKKPLVCSVCNMVFPNRYYLRKHKLRDHENQLYKCKVCIFTSVYPEKLKNHIIKVHVTKKEKNDRSIEKMLTALNTLIIRKVPRKVILEDGVCLGRSKKSTIGFACAVCECVYPSRYSLERHVRSHTGEKPYKCEVCPFSTSYHEHMVRHMTSIHLVVHSDEPREKYIPKHRRNTQEETQEIDPKTGKVRRQFARRRYECAACGLKATHKTDLVTHIKEKHPMAHVESMKNNDGSKIHLIMTASKKPKDKKTLSITCLFCSKVFHDSWKYKVHLRSHTGVKPFKCKTCSYRATTKMSVRDHILRKHTDIEDPKIIVKIVGIDGQSDEVEIPVPQREYKCEFCGEEFENNYTLKTHRIKNHVESKPFSCADCGHREFTKAALLIHCHEEHKDIDIEELTLRNNKPFKVGKLKLPTCEICQKMFSYQSQLYIHQKMHTGERTYKCDNCDYGSNNKLILEKHMIKVHFGLADENGTKKGKKKNSIVQSGPFQCKNCVFETDDKAVYDIHVEKIHGGRVKRKYNKKSAPVVTVDSAVNTDDIELEPLVIDFSKEENN